MAAIVTFVGITTITGTIGTTTVIDTINTILPPEPGESGSGPNWPSDSRPTGNRANLPCMACAKIEQKDAAHLSSRLTSSKRQG